MIRREFFKIVAAGMALVGLPAMAGERQPQSAAELVDWFEHNFACSMGAPWAFVEPRAAEFSDHPDDLPWWQNQSTLTRDYSKLTPYHTYKVEARTEARVLQEIKLLFDGFLSEYPEIKGSLLYWRLPEKIQLRAEQRRDPGEMVATDEQVADGIVKIDRNNCYKDVDSNCWRKNTDRYTVFVGRTRLAIPKMQDLVVQSSKSYAEGWGETFYEFNGKELTAAEWAQQGNPTVSLGSS